MHMELSLNLLWLLLAGVSFPLAWRERSNHALARGHAARRIISLACALVFVFPVISLTDDLHAAQVVMEDSNSVKRISKSSGAPAAGQVLNGSAYLLRWSRRDCCRASLSGCKALRRFWKFVSW